MANRIEVVVMGGSSGAVEALSKILPVLPPHFTIPIVLVLHISPDHPNCLVEVLRNRCRLAVKEAEDKEPLCAGFVYVAPPNYHVLLERDRSLSLSVDDKVHFSRPSIDVLFESAAQAYGKAAAGVLLTGANEDGAHGLAAVRAAGGTTFVQDPETASIRTMPEAALRLNSQHHVVPLLEIASALGELTPVDALGSMG
jgi:two-component system, chemotaxis family, protein-glutamate methylesterase/glutaminase